MTQTISFHQVPPDAGPGYRILIEPTARRIRVTWNGSNVARSERAMVLLETGHLPVYYFPLGDIREELLVPSEHTSWCPFKGRASYWHIRSNGRNGRTVENAVWGYPEPLGPVWKLGKYRAFYWNKMDAWYEEDEEVFVHPRDPYKRVDVLQSSRHVVVFLDGEKLAESRKPRLLFETGLPTRFYLPREDVRQELLVDSDTRTQCPYKGTASYYSVRLQDKLHEDLVWYYPSPIESKIQDRLCFFNEKVDLIVDGKKLERPATPWS